MSERLIAPVVALLLVVSSTAAAAAPDDKAEARRAFDAGVAHAKAGAYREAIDAFTRAYQLSPNFAVLYNVATAQAALGDHAAAVATFERYLAEGAAAVPTDRRAKVTSEIRRLAARTGSIVAHVSPATALVTVDGAPLDAAVAARGARVNAGLHRIGAVADGFLPAEQVVTVAGGAVVAVTLALAPVPPAAPPPAPAPVEIAQLPPPAPPPPPTVTRPLPPPPPPAAAPRTTGAVQRAIGYTLGAAGLVALAAGGVLYMGARSDLQHAVDAGCDQASCTGDGLTSWNRAQDGVRNSRIAAVAGAALLAGGVTLVVVAPSSRDDSAAVAVAVAVAGRF